MYLISFIVYLVFMCAYSLQGAAAVTTVVTTMTNDRRSVGEILDDKTLAMNLSSILRKIQYLKIC